MKWQPEGIDPKLYEALTSSSTPGKVFPVKDMQEVRKYQPETFEDVLDSKIAECRELMIRKQMDYGVGNIAAFGILGVAVRASDKIERLRNLLLKNRNPSNESLRDTFMDLANYGLIGMMLLDGQWGKPLKREEAERVGREVK